MGGGKKTQKAIWRSAHKGRKIKDFDRDCMRAACEHYHLQENPNYPINTDQMSLRMLHQVYLNGSHLTTLGRWAVHFKVGIQYSTDPTEVEQGELIHGFLVPLGARQLVQKKIDENIITNKEPFKLGRLLFEKAKRKGYVKKKVEKSCEQESDKEKYETRKKRRNKTTEATATVSKRPISDSESEETENESRRKKRRKFKSATPTESNSADEASTEPAEDIESQSEMNQAESDKTSRSKSSDETESASENEMNHVESDNTTESSQETESSSESESNNVQSDNTNDSSEDFESGSESSDETETESESKNVESQSEKSKSDEETDSFQQSDRSKKSSDQETQEENIQNQPSNETLEQKQYSPVEQLEEQYSNENVDLDRDLDLRNEDTDVDLPSIEIRPKKKDVDDFDSALDAFNTEAGDLPESVNEMKHVQQSDESVSKTVSDNNEMNHVGQKDENEPIPVSVNVQSDESVSKTVSDNNEMNHVGQKDENEPIPVSVNVQSDENQNISSQETNHVVESGQSVCERSSQNKESTEMHQDSHAEINHDESQGEGDSTMDCITEKKVQVKEEPKEEDKKIDLSVSCKEEIKDVVKNENEVKQESTEENINVESQDEGEGDTTIDYITEVTEEPKKTGKVLSKRRQMKFISPVVDPVPRNTDAEADEKNIIAKEVDNNEFIPTVLDESVVDVSAMAYNAIEFVMREQEIEKQKQKQLQKTLDSLVARAKEIKSSNCVEISDDENADASANNQSQHEPELQIVIQPIVDNSPNKEQHEPRINQMAQAQNQNRNGSSTVYYQNPVQQYPWPVSSFQFPQGYRVVQGNRMSQPSYFPRVSVPQIQTSSRSRSRLPRGCIQAPRQSVPSPHIVPQQQIFPSPRLRTMTPLCQRLPTPRQRLPTTRQRLPTPRQRLSTPRIQTFMPRTTTPLRDWVRITNADFRAMREEVQEIMRHMQC